VQLQDAESEQQQQQQQRRAADQFQERKRPVVGIIEVVEEEEEGDAGTAGAAPSKGAAALAALKRRQQAAKLAALAFEVVALYAASSSSSTATDTDTAAITPTDSSGRAPEASRGADGGVVSAGTCGGLAGVVTNPVLLRLMQTTIDESLRLPTPWSNAEASAAAEQLLGALEALTAAQLVASSRAQPAGEVEEEQSTAGSRRGSLLPAAVVQSLVPQLREPLFAPHRHAQAQERGSSGVYFIKGGLRRGSGGVGLA